MTARDDEGRPAAWVTTTQPEWDAEDRAIVQALLDLKADTCAGCGQRMSKSLHKDGQPDPKWKHDFFTCTSCRSQEAFFQQLEKKDAAAEKNHQVVTRSMRKFVILPDEPAQPPTGPRP